MTTQNAPRDERSLLRRIAQLENRVRTLETAPRAAKTSFSSGVLTVGDPSSANKIELDAGAGHIQFSHGGPAGRLRALTGVGGGASIEGDADVGEVLPFATNATVEVTGIDATLQTTADDITTGAATSVGQVSISMVYSGTDHAPEVSINATSQDLPDDAAIFMDCSGGLTLSLQRSSDPPIPAAGTVVLYTKGSPSRLYYRDPAGTVHGPL